MALACMVHNRCHAYWSANASILSFYDVQLLQKLPIKCSTPSVEVYCILCHTRRCLTLTCTARNCNTSNTRYTYVPIAFALWSSIILFCSHLCHPSKEQIVPTGRMFTLVSNIALTIYQTHSDSIAAIFKMSNKTMAHKNKHQF